MSGPDRVADNPNPDVAATQFDSSAPSNSDAGATVDISAQRSTPASGAFSSGEPKFIGPYQLVSKLGEGGMGQVWLAEQTAPVCRKVALKLIKVGIYDGDVLRRFQAERQSLAMMDHPAIAKVFDAGATADGQPYFVMEYVPGVPITQYCDEKRLTVKQRLELFIKVCEGVQHAHQKAIIHRDLKPANILVAEVDGKPVPRIIDFGLAKAITSELGSETMFTRVGAFVGTPGYMSPEQAEPMVRDVDTRTDVYSLGAVLYVLLTGDEPFDSSTWNRTPLHEVLRQLREDEPPNPSARVRADYASSASKARSRNVQPKQLEALLHGDLDWIAMKALEKDRARRYGSPMELAADIQRHLAHQPVLARPASTAYRVQKYVRRHRVGVALASGLALLLAGVAVMQAIQVRRVVRERDRANRVTDFMKGMFRVSKPSEARGNTVTAREILDRAAKQIDRGLAGDPGTQAQLLAAMGDVYESLGLYPQAHPVFERALGIQQATLGPGNPETLATMDEFATLLYKEGHPASAEKLEREVLEGRRRVLGKEHPDTLISMRHLAWSLYQQGRLPEAEKLERETLQLDRRVLGAENPETAKAMNDLAAVIQWQGNYQEAETLDREALEIRRRILGSDDPDTLASMDNLAGVLGDEAHYADEIKMDSDLIDIERRVLGREHPDTLGTMGSLSWILQVQGRYADAAKLAQQTLDIQRRVLGAEHPDTLRTTITLAATLADEKQYPQAEKLFQETLEIRRRTLGPDHRDTLLAATDLAITYGMEKRYVDEEKVLREVLSIQRRVLAADHPDVLLTMQSLASCLKNQRRYAEAESEYSELLEIGRRVLAPNDVVLVDAVYSFACLEALEGHKSDALKYLAEAVDHGLIPVNVSRMEKDPELKSLHGDPRFAALVADAKRRLNAAPNSGGAH